VRSHNYNYTNLIRAYHYNMMDPVEIMENAGVIIMIVIITCSPAKATPGGFQLGLASKWWTGEAGDTGAVYSNGENYLTTSWREHVFSRVVTQLVQHIDHERALTHNNELKINGIFATLVISFIIMVVKKISDHMAGRKKRELRVVESRGDRAIQP